MTDTKKKTRKMKLVLTNRQRLWKQVNTKVKQVSYTFNPNIYEHSIEYYELTPQAKETSIANYYNSDSFTWADIASNIDWSEIETTNNDKEIICIEDDTITPILSDFDFDEFDIEEITYNKMWS